MKRRSRLLILAVVVAQLLFLLGIVGYKETILRTGKIIVLQTMPVDPRDLFRGDYVTLRYAISTLESSKIKGLYSVDEGETVYVRLGQEGEVWVAKEGEKEPRPEWDVFLKGKVTDIIEQRTTDGGSQTDYRIEYGLEAYFVPEGAGRRIEGARDLKARVAVNGFGDAVIKGLIVDGEPFELR